MRTAPLLIAVFLLAGAAALTFFPIPALMQGVAPSTEGEGEGPGAYPLGESRPQLASIIRSSPFQPTKAMGSDAVAPSTVLDQKKKCLKECPAIMPNTKSSLFF
jgi:hypothetical protein